MRRISIFLLSFAFSAGAFGAAQLLQPAGGPAAPEPPKALNVGDAAPVLDIANWVKGGPIKFEKDHAYVVEFWATWCGPCRISIPKLTALQQKYPDKKLTVIGVSIDQAGLETVKAFVDKQGDRMGYVVALDAGRTSRDYLQASNQGGIPFAFVVDGAGKLAWRGHPNDGLELIAGEVAAGTFDAKRHAERGAKFLELDKAYSQAIQEQKWDVAERTLDEIVKVRPDLEPTLFITRFWILAGGRNDQPGALSYARHLADNELKNEPEALTLLADKVVGTAALSPADQTFATGLAKRAVDLTKSKNGTALVIYSEALKREGKLDESIAATQLAVDATSEEMEKRFYADRLEELKKAKQDAAKAAETAKPTEAKPGAPMKP